MRQAVKIRAVAIFVDALLPFIRIWIVAGFDAAIVFCFTIGAASPRAGLVYRSDHKKTADHNSQDQKLSIKFQVGRSEHNFLLYFGFGSGQQRPSQYRRHSYCSLLQPVRQASLFSPGGKFQHPLLFIHSFSRSRHTEQQQGYQTGGSHIPGGLADAVFPGASAKQRLHNRTARTRNFR